MIPSRKGLTLGEVLIVCGILVLLAALVVPGLLQSRRVSNERGASSVLATLASAEADFRANDRDGNGVNDFWTADVKGLYTMTSARVPGAGVGAGDPPLKLIDVSTAAADLDPAHVPAGGENMQLGTFARPAPLAGYWFAAMIVDRSAEPSEAAYRRDTQGSLNMGACHNKSKFGFVTLPDSSSSGKYLFILNENNTQFRMALSGSTRTGGSVPGLDAVHRIFLDWPADGELKSFFSHCCD